MAIFETFSKRKKRLAMAGQQDVFQYDDLPPAFRAQVFHIWKSALGQYYVPRGYSTGHAFATNEYWDVIHDTIATEAGLFHLGSKNDEKNQRCVEYMLNASTDDALSIIELSFRVIDKAVRDKYGYLPVECGVIQEADEAIEELNHRFKEHAIGYQYVDGILMRIDSQFLHAEIVKPALSLLSAKGFEGPADEFIKAFDHYRHRRNKEAVAEALKSFESTMKSI